MAALVAVIVFLGTPTSVNFGRRPYDDDDYGYGSSTGGTFPCRACGHGFFGAHERAQHEPHCDGRPTPA